MNHKYGVVVGRFQVPELHSGHREFLKTVQERHAPFPIVVALGVSQWPTTKRNPLDYAVRVEMIREAFPQAIIFPVYDHHDNSEWVHALDRAVKALCPFGAVLYGGRDSFIDIYTSVGGAYETVVMTQFPDTGSGTEERFIAGAAPVRGSNRDFRHGVIYATQRQWPKVYPTADVVPFKHKGNHIEILVGKKKLFKEQVITIGGFVDPTDDDIKQAAWRELMEEANLLVNGRVPDLTFIGSTRVQDWRLRGDADSIMTFVFGADLGEGSDVYIHAGDDLDELAWMRMTRQDLENGPEYLRLQFAPHHRPIFDMWRAWYLRTYSAVQVMPDIVAPCSACVSEHGKVDPACRYCQGTGRGDRHPQMTQADFGGQN